MSDIQPVQIENPTPPPGRQTTPRGFAIYGEGRDSYNTRMRVQQSSSASMDAVWLFVGGPAPDDAPDFQNGLPNNGSLHLNATNARWLRDRLGEWLDDVDGEDMERATCGCGYSIVNTRTAGSTRPRRTSGATTTTPIQTREAAG